MEQGEFIKHINEKYGTDDDDWRQLTDAAVIKFDTDKKGNVSGIYHGTIVFMNSASDETIQPGDIWICDLKRNPKLGSNNYFATPLRKVDASFIFEMKKEDLAEFAGMIWSKYREEIEPEMKDRYMDAVNAEITKAKEESRSEFETERVKMAAKIEELEQKDVENRKIINSLQNKISSADTAEKRTAVQGTAGAGTMQGMLPSSDVSVERTGPDTISSEFFDRSRYTVRLSADYRKMAVIPDDNGSVVCIDNEMTLAGLNMISPFTESGPMISEYSSAYGGVLIYLKRAE